MKKKRNLYIIAFLFFITLVGVTIAYLQSSAVFENIFNAGTYKTVTHEEFTSPSNWTPGDETPKTITTKNEGTIPVRVRVKFDEEWTSKNGDPLDLTYNGENVAIINFDNVNDWILKDGYYYYAYELNPGEETTSPINGVTFNPNYNGNVTCTFNDITNSIECVSDGGYLGGEYNLNITIEAVQSDAYRTLWNVVIVEPNPCTYEGELVTGAEYINGQYTYRYSQERSVGDGWNDIEKDGWGVAITDRESTDAVTTKLCTSINNKAIVSMKNMFYKSKAEAIDLSSFDTFHVESMGGMFTLANASSLDFSTFDTRNVTSMSSMFHSSKATTLDLSNFNTSNVINMRLMFAAVKINELDLSSFDTSNVIYMNNMFAGAKIENLILTSFDTHNVTDMHSMFYNSNIPTVDLSSFDTSNVTDMRWMFENSQAATGYARTQADADKFNSSSNKPSTLTFVVKGS